MMRRFQRLCLCAVLCAVPSVPGVRFACGEETPPPAAAVVAAPAATLDEALAGLDSVRKTLKTFEAKVLKTRHVVPFEDTEQLDGRVRFKTPRLVCLELKSRETGFTTRFYVGEKMAYTYRPDDKQAEGIPLKSMEEKVRKGNPLEYGLVSGPEELKKSYDLALLPEETVTDAARAVLQMTPKGAEPDDKNGVIVLWLDKKTWLPVQIREFKSNGDVIETLTFSEIVTNRPLDNAIFNFVPGKDVDVVIHPAD